jgi:hypothetical protein
MLLGRWWGRELGRWWGKVLEAVLGHRKEEVKVFEPVLLGCLLGYMRETESENKKEKERVEWMDGKLARVKEIWMGRTRAMKMEKR